MTDTPPPARRASDDWLYGLKRIPNIFLYGDITFACVVLGMGMILWGVLGLLRPIDLQWFAAGFALEVAPWLWGVNHLLVGVGFIHVAVRHFPRGRCLLLGTYGAVAWTWIMMGRPSSSFSSGVTLNIIIVFMSMLIVQRSGAKK
jgi:hypothetical protein